jgi:hypothetical protein
MADDPRLVVSTINAKGRATFNQVTQIRAADHPEMIVLVAVLPGEGLYVWRHAHVDIDAHAHEQHAGYSRQVGPIDPKRPPSWLGAPTIVASADLDSTLWGQIVAARTNTLKKLVGTVLGI